MAIEPSSGAVREDNAPLNFPIGVRTALKMYVSSVPEFISAIAKFKEFVELFFPLQRRGDDEH